MTTQEIWNLYAADVGRFILSKVKNVMIADDLLQDTFIKVHTNKERLRVDSKLKPWIFSIARHAVTDHFRNLAPNSELIEPNMSAEEKISHSKEDCLHGIIQKLPLKYRAPIMLSEIKGLKQAEVADQLHLPLPTVKSQLQRARKLIAQGYMDCCDFKMNADGLLIGELQAKGDCKVCR